MREKRISPDKPATVKRNFTVGERNMSGCGDGRTGTGPVRFSVSLDTKDQTHEKVMAVVDALLRENLAIECGIMAEFSFELGRASNEQAGSEVAPELKRNGVISLKKTAAH
jgi:hypothetical protein